MDEEQKKPREEEFATFNSALVLPGTNILSHTMRDFEQDLLKKYQEGNFLIAQSIFLGEINQFVGIQERNEEVVDFLFAQLTKDKRVQVIASSIGANELSSHLSKVEARFRANNIDFWKKYAKNIDLVLISPAGLHQTHRQIRNLAKLSASEIPQIQAFTEFSSHGAESIIQFPPIGFEPADYATLYSLFNKNQEDLELVVDTSHSDWENLGSQAEFYRDKVNAIDAQILTILRRIQSEELHPDKDTVKQIRKWASLRGKIFAHLRSLTRSLLANAALNLDQVSNTRTKDNEPLIHFGSAEQTFVFNTFLLAFNQNPTLTLSFLYHHLFHPHLRKIIQDHAGDFGSIHIFSPQFDPHAPHGGSLNLDPDTEKYIRYHVLAGHTHVSFPFLTPGKTLEYLLAQINAE